MRTTDEEKAYWDGVYARRKGETTNPYLPRTNLGDAWQEGFENGKYDDPTDFLTYP